MGSPHIRNIIFTLLQPGLITGLIPWLILKNTKAGLKIYEPVTWLGIILFILGLIVTLKCIIQFPSEGKGTISPLDPTKKLVVKGLYKYSRNPMYVGVLMILIGQSVTFQSKYLLVYALIVLLGFHLFILWHEEPRLIKDFGQQYLAYIKRVRRWL